ncbi:protein ECT2 [Lingula anatina]|uniref:Protein ECT2 n=1 Tax=Lingula anatina TaxID=7574 RepID=A0A1S3JZJ5_LINAN|nr:protein ECT2 [Lingula anatina]|eukprot:XP_013415818.1 protein ECT2 [Lingula anatina]
MADSLCSTSASCSMETLAESREERRSLEEKRFVIINNCCERHPKLLGAVKQYGLPIFYSESGMDFARDADYDTVFVTDNFNDGTYFRLRGEEVRIAGPPVVISSASKKEHIPFSSRPLYCTSMQNLIMCFTGFKQKAELSKMADYVHHMGGSIRKDFSTRVTHLVANCTGGEKYRAAVSLGTPIMSSQWVQKAWEARDDLEFSATEERMMEYRMKPFDNCCLGFLGFPAEEQRHMEEVTVANGGRHVPAGDSDCTHLVIDHSISSKDDVPFETHHKLNMVTGEWFWASIQMEACAEETMYQFEKIEKTPSSAFNTPSSGSRMRKRKRLKDTLTQLASDGELDSPIMYHKRRSSEHMLSLSASLIDVTPDIATPLGLETATPGAPTANISKRKQVIMELLQTENNYVAILDTVLTIFKEGIENPNQPGGPLLPPTDVKLIFGTIPSIFQIHSKICEELASLVANWREECSVGDVIVRHASELTKAYPPFVNFFEQTKATIEECDRTNTRFHAFLMVCKNKPECCRQTLKELLIRPVQRLPSVVLLLNDIKKHTNKNFSDYAALEKAVNALNEVLKHINEDKRKTEGQVAMFEVVNDIENCPPNLLSSHRSYITKVDVIDLSTELRGKGDALTLYLFSDSLEICRRRRAGNFKSPAPSKTPQKPYKHIEMLPLASVKRVADITEGEDCKNVFSLICRSSLDAREKLYSFSLCTDGVSKEEFLQTLCKGIASTTCKTDWESLLVSLDAKMLDIAASDPGKQVLKRFGKRVSRAFSFNKTPRKLKRALSSMSPFVKENHHAQDKDGRMPCTPRQELGMRLATSDLNDIADSPLQSYPSTPSLVHKFNTIGPADSRKLGL